MTFQDIALTALVFAIPYYVGLYLHHKLGRNCTTALFVIGGVVIGLIASTVLHFHIHDLRNAEARDAALDRALTAPCREPMPASPELRNIRELQCSPTRNAQLGDLNIVATHDLVGVYTLKSPQGRVVRLLDESGNPIIDLTSDAMFVTRRDHRIANAREVIVDGVRTRLQ